MTNPQLLRTITVLPVSGIAQATAWYEAVLGFETVYLHEGGTPDEVTNYAVLTRDQVAVHLILDEPPPHRAAWTIAGTGYLYMTVRDIEAFHAEVVSRGGEPGDVHTTNWGAQGFVLADPDGNAIRLEQSR